MTIFEKELSELKPHDPVQFTELDEKTLMPFIHTAGHGYLVIPRNGSERAVRALSLCKYGFKGEHAIYLEEDVEYGQFVELINKLKI
jgi:hypothetical protein